MSLKALREQLEKEAAESQTLDDAEIDKVAATRELIESMDRDELVELFGKEAVEAVEAAQKDEVEKTASEEEVTEEDVKVAEDLVEAGRIMARGFMDELGQAEE